jgi:DNA-directed RNA polymerase subunit RPC12/RpoP
VGYNLIFCFNCMAEFRLTSLQILVNSRTWEVMELVCPTCSFQGSDLEDFEVLGIPVEHGKPVDNGNVLFHRNGEFSTMF